MYLQNLKLNNFKNCQSAELSFSEKINCFVGLNAAGKTNVMDSIYYLAFCKSYFSLTDKQNIKHIGIPPGFSDSYAKCFQISRK